MTRYIDELTMEGFISCNGFVTNGRKLYRGTSCYEKIRQLKSLCVIEYDKCDFDTILNKLKKYHPNCPEVAILEDLKEQLVPLYVGIYDTWKGNVIKYFITYSLPYVAYGNGAQYINKNTSEEIYVSYSTGYLGKYGVPSLESFKDKDLVANFVNTEARKHTFTR